MSQSNQQDGSARCQKELKSQLLISPGWSHYTITAPLSPKAHVSVSKKLRQISERSPSFSALHHTSLQVAMLDLGILPMDNEFAIKQRIEKALKPYASLKIQTTKLRSSHAIPPHDEPVEGEPALLWVEVRDRLGVLSSLSRDLITELKGVAPHISYPAPAAWLEDRKFKRESAVLLAGEISTYQTDVYDQVFSCSAWVNDIVLQKRPSHFVPARGYESIWRYSLPLETPPLSEIENEDPVHSSTPKRLKSSLEYPLQGKDLEVMEVLETHLATLDTETSSITKRRRSNRRKSRPSKPTMGSAH